jgi:hypothetical protein
VRIRHSPDTAGESVQPGPRNRGSGYTPEVVEQQTILVSGNPQPQRCQLGGHHRHSDLHMGRLIPSEKNRSQQEGREAVGYTSTVRTTGSLKAWLSMVPVVV